MQCSCACSQTVYHANCMRPGARLSKVDSFIPGHHPVQSLVMIKAYMHVHVKHSRCHVTSFPSYCFDLFPSSSYPSVSSCRVDRYLAGYGLLAIVLVTVVDSPLTVMPSLSTSSGGKADSGWVGCGWGCGCRGVG